MTALKVLTGLVFILAGLLGMLTGGLFTVGGICGPAPDAWKILLVGFLALVMGLVMIAPPLMVAYRNSNDRG